MLFKTVFCRVGSYFCSVNICRNLRTYYRRADGPANPQNKLTITRFLPMVGFGECHVPPCFTTWFAVVSLGAIKRVFVYQRTADVAQHRSPTTAFRVALRKITTQIKRELTDLAPARELVWQGKHVKSKDRHEGTNTPTDGAYYYYLLSEHKR